MKYRKTRTVIKKDSSRHRKTNRNKEGKEHTWKYSDMCDR